MTTFPVAALVIAKAPVPGLAKTRLAATIGDDAAAHIAAAALLDTLDAVAATPVQSKVVALTGELTEAACGDEIRQRLADFTVVPQRGPDFAERLANAHADAFTGLPVLQIGMDTPQVSADMLAECADELLSTDAVLGLAEDGGWWVLGVTEPAMADCLRTVPMSQSNTGALTLSALYGQGVSVKLVAELVDVDAVADVEAVRRMCPAHSRFARATRAVGV